MTDFNQAGGRHVLDLPFSNVASAADIPAGTAVIMDPANDKAVIVPTSGGGVAASIGITIDTLTLGGPPGRVRVLGVAEAIADGSITRGDYIQVSDTATKMGRVKTGTTTELIGQAFASAADGDPVEVFLLKSRNT